MRTIGAGAFDGCSNLEAIYYIGTRDDFKEINKRYNAYLSEIAIFWYSESAPKRKGKYWHYVDGVPTAW